MMAQYNRWANARLYDAASKLPDEHYRKDIGLFFKSVHGTLNHLLVGEHRLWFARFAEGVSPKLRLDEEIEPDRAKLKQALLDGARRWEPFLDTLDSNRFAGPIDYVSTKGVAQSLPFSATLAHVFNHGTHHRGQITAAITAMGHPCPELDLVWMLQMESKS